MRWLVTSTSFKRNGGVFSVIRRNNGTKQNNSAFIQRLANRSYIGGKEHKEN